MLFKARISATEILSHRKSSLRYQEHIFPEGERANHCPKPVLCARLCPIKPGFETRWRQMSIAVACSALISFYVYSRFILTLKRKRL